jgi:hypothetical protein
MKKETAGMYQLVDGVMTGSNGDGWVSSSSAGSYILEKQSPATGEAPLQCTAKRTDLTSSSPGEITCKNEGSSIYSLCNFDGWYLWLGNGVVGPSRTTCHAVTLTAVCVDEPATTTSVATTTAAMTTDITTTAACAGLDQGCFGPDFPCCDNLMCVNVGSGRKIDLRCRPPVATSTSTIPATTTTAPAAIPTCTYFGIKFTKDGLDTRFARSDSWGIEAINAEYRSSKYRVIDGVITGPSGKMWMSKPSDNSFIKEKSLAADGYAQAQCTFTRSDLTSTAPGEISCGDEGRSTLQLCPDDGLYLFLGNGIQISPQVCTVYTITAFCVDPPVITTVTTTSTAATTTTTQATLTTLAAGENGVKNPGFEDSENTNNNGPGSRIGDWIYDTRNDGSSTSYSFNYGGAAHSGRWYG